MVKTTPLHVKDAYVIEYPRFSDDRGFLEEIYNEDKYPTEISQHFRGVKQNTLASSHKDVLRGIHISPYAKLMTCVKGSVYDVVVDLRCESPTYLKWAAVILSDVNQRQLLVPPYCGHGYYSLEEGSTVLYVQGGCFNPPYEGGISPFDDVVDVCWPTTEGVTPLLSQKDEVAPCLTLSPRFSISVNPKRKRFLIIGASGQVGGSLMEAISQNPNNYVAIGTYNEHNQQDRYLIPFSMETAARDDSVCENLLASCRPHVVCICAAFSWVDGNELFPQKAQSINVTAVLNIAKAAKCNGSKVVFYSSDYVFDGERSAEDKALLTEEIEPQPLCTYGQYKRDAERALLDLDKTTLIMRISRVYGPEVQGKNFVYGVEKAAGQGSAVPCLTTEISCPTYNRDIAKATLGLIEKASSGTYHCAGPQILSKHEWGTQVCALLGIGDAAVRPVHQLDDSAAKRPKMVAMSTQKLRETLPSFKFRSLEEAFTDWRDSPYGKELISLRK